MFVGAKDHEDLFLVWPPKTGLWFYCKGWASFFPRY